MNKCAIIIFLIFMVTVSLGQVTFTPSWGKRGLNQGVDNNCRTSIDVLMMINKLLQVSIHLNKII